MNKRPELKVSNEKPPVWDKLEKAFGVKWESTNGKSVVVAFGDTIHCSQEPTNDVLAHELIHLDQQGYSRIVAKEWYEKYISDPIFRLSQEVPAYKEQIRVAAMEIKDRNDLMRYRINLANDLSGAMYGKMCSKSQAMKLLL